jgi:hypothetical protein
VEVYPNVGKANTEKVGKQNPSTPSAPADEEKKE